MEYTLQSRVSGKWDVGVEGCESIGLENGKQKMTILQMLGEALVWGNPKEGAFEASDKTLELLSVDENKRIIRGRRKK
ncbi:MAG: hypothetical protein HYZ51_02775 [Candidatus Doudnabacteria bacterium]|nr:hypothetical protein [Candidatus Doudnabacteria bacterium]